MSRATPDMRELAAWLTAAESKRSKSSQPSVPPAILVSEKLRPHLATVMGRAGYRALITRALGLANAEIPWLHAVRVNEEGSLEGFAELAAQLDPKEFSEDSVVLIAQLLGLLSAFIGTGLTVRLLGEIWPKLPSQNLMAIQGTKK